MLVILREQFEMKLFIILSFISFVFYSCGGNSRQISIDDTGVIIVPLNFDGIPSINQLTNMDKNSLSSILNKYSIEITQLVDSVSFIKLETKNECLIGRISKVFFIDNRFFIHEKQTSTILVFDVSGKFLYKFGNKGRGPGEYVQISSFLLDEKKKMLMIYDDSSRKMIFYLLDGTLVKEIPRFSDGKVIRDIINLPDGRFICYKFDYEGEKYPCGVWEVDSLGKVGRYFIKQKTKYPNVFSNETYFYKLQEDQVGLWCADVNDIYHFSDTSSCKYMTLIPNRKTVNDYPNMDNSSNYQMIKKRKVIEKGNFLITEWNDNKNQFQCTTVYFKKENDMKIALGLGYGINNIGAIPGFDVDYNVPNQMMNVIYAQDFDYLKESNYVSEGSKKFLTSFFDKDFEENPILQVLYVKNETYLYSKK